MLKLMYITNDPEIALIAENAGVDRIFIDLEYIGKSIRQGGMDTVQSHHTIDDIYNVRNTIKKAQIVVRVNPIHDATDDYCSSEDEINAVIKAGADLVMLPYFQSVEEVERFVNIVDGRARVFLLLESKKGYEAIDDILEISTIDEIHIGLNDLSLDFGLNFMFELLTNGTVEKLCKKFEKKGIPYGFGGIGRLGKGELPAEYIIKEHYRLRSECAILSRSFCNAKLIKDKNEIIKIFNEGVKEIRALESECKSQNENYFRDNEIVVKTKVKKIIEMK